MLFSMRHIEIHVIESELDSIAATSSGLLTDPFFSGYCSTCADEVGVLDETFEPYVVVLEGDDDWILCSYCAEAVTDPEELDPPTFDEGEIEDDEFLL